MRPAQHGSEAVLLGSLGHLPGVDDQRCGGGDADQLVGLALLLGLLDVVLDRHVLDGRVVDERLMAALAQRRGQVAEP